MLHCENTASNPRVRDHGSSVRGAMILSSRSGPYMCDELCSWGSQVGIDARLVIHRDTPSSVRACWEMRTNSLPFSERDMLSIQAEAAKTATQRAQMHVKTLRVCRRLEGATFSCCSRLLGCCASCISPRRSTGGSSEEERNARALAACGFH